MSEMPPAAAKAKRVPRWLWALMIALVLMVAAGLILPYFLDADRYRTLIAAAIESETGRTVSLGRIRLRLLPRVGFVVEDFRLDRKSTRLNSSHRCISYAVFCLKKK